MNLNSNFARRLCNLLGLRRERYAVGQHDLACADLGINNGPDDAGPTLHESVQDLKLERDILRNALEHARSVVRAVKSLHDAERVTGITDLERVSEKVDAALRYGQPRRDADSWDGVRLKS